MDITNVLKDHGIGISSVDELKEFKLLKDIAQPGDRTYFDSYGDFDDNVNLALKQVDTWKIDMLKMNVVTENNYTTIRTLYNVKMAGTRPRLSKKYFFAVVYAGSVTSDGLLKIFSKDGIREIQNIDWGNVYNKSLGVFEDSVTGNIAVHIGVDMIVFDKDLNIIKDRFELVSNNRPTMGIGTVFYNGYIYSTRIGNTLIKYDYQTNTVVNVLSSTNYVKALICNGPKNRIWIAGDNTIYDLDFNKISNANGYYNSDGTGTLNLIEKIPSADGNTFMITRYGFGIEYNLNKNNLKARLLTETSQVSDYGHFFTNSDNKTLLYMTDSRLYVYTR
ncbi:TPA: hypothetical protein ACJFE8_000830 [Clostridium sporogenes]